MLEIKAVWLRSKKRYGYRKIAIALKNRYGETVNHKKVLRLRKERDVCAVLSGHGKPYSSYRGTVGKVYFSPVIDFFNDQILAYSLSMSPNRKRVRDRLSGLYGKYPDTAGRILHSDQGWQYQRPAYRSSLKKHGIVQSRSRKGNCLDNAKTENLFSKLKKEMYYGHEKDFRSYAEVSKAIDEYVQWYNEERIVTRLRAAPVSHRSYAPIPLLCYTSHQVQHQGFSTETGCLLITFRKPSYSKEDSSRILRHLLHRWCLEHKDDLSLLFLPSLLLRAE